MKRIDALLRAGEIDGALACFHPNIEWRVLGQQRGLPNSGNGIDSLRSRLMPFEDVPDHFILGHMILTSDVDE